MRLSKWLVSTLQLFADNPKKIVLIFLTAGTIVSVFVQTQLRSKSTLSVCLIFVASSIAVKGPLKSSEI